MMLIAHRGNLDGRNPIMENMPNYIDTALKQDVSCEIDLRYFNDKLYLGHDAPQYEVSLNWLRDRSSWLWIHCKNSMALEFCLNNNLHCFWHDTDDYTMTNRGYVWAYPGKFPAGRLTIMVMPESAGMLQEIKEINPFGVCTDYVNSLKA